MLEFLFAGLANMLATFIIIQLLKLYAFPVLRGSVLLPIMAIITGVVLAFFQTFFAVWRGIPAIELLPAAGLFTGAAAVAVSQICKIVTMHSPESRARKLLS